MSKTTITCSRCGHRSEEVERNQSSAEDLVSEGWGSYGSAVYCPTCTESWAERNPGRPLSNALATVLTITSRMLDEAEQDIRYLKGGTAE